MIPSVTNFKYVKRWLTLYVQLDFDWNKVMTFCKKCHLYRYFSWQKMLPVHVTLRTIFTSHKHILEYLRGVLQNSVSTFDVYWQHQEMRSSTCKLSFKAYILASLWNEVLMSGIRKCPLQARVQDAVRSLQTLKLVWLQRTVVWKLLLAQLLSLGSSALTCDVWRWKHQHYYTLHIQVANDSS